MKKILTLLPVLFLAGMLFCGCEQEDDRIHIGVMIYRYDDNFMSFVRNAIEANAGPDVVLSVNDSENDQQKQEEQIDRLIATGVDVLAVNLVDADAAPRIIEKAESAGIPVVFFNREPSQEDLMRYDRCLYVGTSSEESGVLQGRLILESWKSHPKWDKNGDGKLQYVLIEGEPDHPDALARSTYAISTLTDAGIQVEELERRYAQWDSLQAKDVMDAMLDRYDNRIEYVISNNDSMALGAVASLQSKGYFANDKFMPVVGVDAIPEILSKIENGLVVGTIMNDAKNQGKAIMELAKNLALGKAPLEGTQWVMDDGKAVRIPYRLIVRDNTDLAR